MFILEYKLTNQSHNYNKIKSDRRHPHEKLMDN